MEGAAAHQLAEARTTPMTLDRRLNAFRDDLADSALRGRVRAPRYVEGKPARIAAGLVPVLREKRPGSPVETFFHFGEAVRVFDESGGFAWCQSRCDGYVGYIAAAALARGEAPAPTHYVAGLGAYRYPEADLRAPAIDFLPRHSPLVVAQGGFVCRGTRYARLDGGGFLPEACIAAEPPRSPDLAAAAALYLGCPYLWAGRSCLGIDCSGLVQQAFRDLGQSVLRDTDMQRKTIGAAPAIRQLRELRRNDLVYIPGHVMICANRGTVIHASGGAMAVRREGLAALLRASGHTLADITVRRP